MLHPVSLSRDVSLPLGLIEGGGNRKQHGIPGVPFPIGLPAGAAGLLRCPLMLRSGLSSALTVPSSPLRHSCWTSVTRPQIQTLRSLENNGPDALGCNAVTTGLLADGVAAGLTAFLSHFPSQRLPGDFHPGQLHPPPTQKPAFYGALSCPGRSASGAGRLD